MVVIAIHLGSRLHSVSAIGDYRTALDAVDVGPRHAVAADYADAVARREIVRSVERESASRNACDAA